MFGGKILLQSSDSVAVSPTKNALDFRMVGFAVDYDVKTGFRQTLCRYLGTVDEGAGGIQNFAEARGQLSLHQWAYAVGAYGGDAAVGFVDLSRDFYSLTGKFG